MSVAPILESIARLVDAVSSTRGPAMSVALEPPVTERAPWWARGWGITAWALGLLLLTIAATHYLGPGVVIWTLVGAGVAGFVAAVVTGNLRPEVPIEERHPPRGALSILSAGVRPPLVPTPELDAFLARLRALDKDEWQGVLYPRLAPVRRRLEDGALRRAFRTLQQRVAAERRQDDVAAVARAVQDAMSAESATENAGLFGQTFARIAATALVMRPVLADAEFRGLYAPFERVIPAASLDVADVRSESTDGTTP
jgi:hypothetical protein